MQTMNSVQDLLIQTLGELHATETRQLHVLPLLLREARTPRLRDALRRHERETRTHVQRLEQIFRRVGRPAADAPGPVPAAMASRGEELLRAAASPEVAEAALIGEARKFDHAEMAGYETAAAMARRLGNQAVADLLAASLREEQQSDRRLSLMAEPRDLPQAVLLQQQQQQQQQAAD
jgi:ferritin-like metal-binding protein YciE